MKTGKSEVIKISIAAARLGLSREAATRRVLCGELEGWKDDEGKWVVTTKSVERYERTKQSGS